MEGFNFTLPYRVRACDLNYGGHVAGPVVLDYLQDARLAYLEKIGGYSEISLGDGVGTIMPEVHVRYLAEMFLNDRIEIGVKVVELKRAAFVTNYRIEREGKPCAEATVPMVAFDYKARKVVSLPEAFVEAVRRFEGMEP